MSQTAEIHSRWVEFRGAAIKTATEWLAVFIATWGFVFGVVGCTLAGIAIWIAYDANENAKVISLQLQQHMREDH